MLNGKPIKLGKKLFFVSCLSSSTTLSHCHCVPQAYLLTAHFLFVSLSRSYCFGLAIRVFFSFARQKKFVAKIVFRMQNGNLKEFIRFWVDFHKIWCETNILFAFCRWKKLPFLIFCLLLLAFFSHLIAPNYFINSLQHQFSSIKKFRAVAASGWFLLYSVAVENLIK